MRLFFLGHNQSLCLHAKDYPQLKANHVYFADDEDLYIRWYKNNQRDVGVLDLENNKNSEEDVQSPKLLSNLPTSVWLIPNLRRSSGSHG